MAKKNCFNLLYIRNKSICSNLLRLFDFFKLAFFDRGFIQFPLCTGGEVKSGLPPRAQTERNSVTDAITNWVFDLEDIFETIQNSVLSLLGTADNVI